MVPGVVYVPMVGKVTVAMLERNLMRLYENFHAPGAEALHNIIVAKETAISMRLHWYTAGVTTALLFLEMVRTLKK